MPNTAIGLDQALKYFEYHPETGHFGWRVRYKRGAPGASVTRKNENGYLMVGFGKRTYAVQRIIWLMVTGEWPRVMIDHINGNRADNRWCNLRPANFRENSANTAKPQTNNTSGIRGVSYVANQSKPRIKRWIARTKFPDGKYRVVGYFLTKEEASEAYRRKHREIHGEYSPY